MSNVGTEVLLIRSLTMERIPGPHAYNLARS